MSNKEEFAEIMMKLVTAFNVQPSPARTAIYWEELKDYPIERLKKSASYAIKSCSMFPSVAELIQFLPPPKQPEALPEPPLTLDDITYGGWMSRFAVWLVVSGKSSEKTKTREEKQKLWDEFCRELKVPEKVAAVRII